MIIGFFILQLWLNPVSAQAPPPIPCEFQGTVTIGGIPAPIGTIIQTKVYGTVRGTETTTQVGQYAFLSVQITADEYSCGCSIPVEFYVNGYKADQTSTFTAGAVKILNLTFSSAPTPTFTTTASPTPTLPSPPVAHFKATPLSGSAPLEVKFSDRSSNTPTMWFWDFGDNQTSNKRNLTHLYRKEGKYTVTLVVANLYGSNSTSKKDHIVVLKPNLSPFPGCSLIPTDLNGDGYYEDINGNGRIDFNDLIRYFQYLGWIPLNEPVPFFDYNGNGNIDFNDLIRLFNQI